MSTLFLVLNTVFHSAAFAAVQVQFCASVALRTKTEGEMDQSL